MRHTLPGVCRRDQQSHCCVINSVTGLEYPHCVVVHSATQTQIHAASRQRGREGKRGGVKGGRESWKGEGWEVKYMPSSIWHLHSVHVYLYTLSVKDYFEVVYTHQMTTRPLKATKMYHTSYLTTTGYIASYPGPPPYTHNN